MNLKFYTLSFISLILAFTLQTSIAQIPTNGLVGYFMLDGNPVDSSGMANDGSILGQVSPTANRFGEESKACLFEGGFIDAGNRSDFKITDGITIAAWINLIEVNDWVGIITKWSQFEGGYFLGINPDNNILRFNILGTEPTDGNPLILDEWIHIAATFDGDTIKTYQDGILSSSTYNNTPIGDNEFNLTIGTQSNATTALFSGSIDDVLIYNRGLNQSGIDSIFNSQILSNTNDFITARSVELFPNPTNNILNINNSSEYQILSNTLYNVNGVKLKTTDFQETFDISDQPSGIYYLKINFEDGSMIKKVIKQ